MAPFYMEESLILCFTLEEEFRLHDLIVRRETICEETMKFRLQQAPFVITSMYKEFSRAMEKNRKIIFSESFFDFYFTKGREFASQMIKANFEELEVLDQTIAYRSVFNSYPAIYCMMMSAIQTTKDLGLKEQCKFTGKTGETACGLMCRDIPNFGEMRGVRIDDYSMFTKPMGHQHRR